MARSSWCWKGKWTPIAFRSRARRHGTPARPRRFCRPMEASWPNPTASASATNGWIMLFISVVRFIFKSWFCIFHCFDYRKVNNKSKFRVHRRRKTAAEQLMFIWTWPASWHHSAVFTSSSRVFGLYCRFNIKNPFLLTWVSLVGQRDAEGLDYHRSFCKL